jgi:hypothetical protein
LLTNREFLEIRKKTLSDFNIAASRLRYFIEAHCESGALSEELIFQLETLRIELQLYVRNFGIIPAKEIERQLELPENLMELHENSKLFTRS